MKRSKAIELILTKLQNLQLGTDDGLYEISEFTLAKNHHALQILEYIEELGMLPPPQEIIPATDNSIYCIYPKIEEVQVSDEEYILDEINSQLWEEE